MHSDMIELILDKRMFILHDSWSSILLMYSHIINDEQKEEEEKKIDYVNSKNPLDISLDDRTGCIQMCFVILSRSFAYKFISYSSKKNSR